MACTRGLLYSGWAWGSHLADPPSFIIVVLGCLIKMSPTFIGGAESIQQQGRQLHTCAPCSLKYSLFLLPHFLHSGGMAAGALHAWSRQPGARAHPQASCNPRPPLPQHASPPITKARGEAGLQDLLLLHQQRDIRCVVGGEVRWHSRSASCPANCAIKVPAAQCLGKHAACCLLLAALLLPGAASTFTWPPAVCAWVQSTPTVRPASTWRTWWT